MGWLRFKAEEEKGESMTQLLLLMVRRRGATASVGGSGVKPGSGGDRRLKRMGHGSSWAG
jgi:hypothetical protein